MEDQFQELVERLGLDPNVDETATKVLEAAGADLERFRSFLGVSATAPALGLSILPERTEKPEAFGWDDLLSALQRADAITLEAEPGGGKTTTILELAARSLNNGHVPIFVSLPELEANDFSLLDAVAARAAFNQRVTVLHLQALARHGRLVLLMDGCNELSSPTRNRFRLILESFRRD